MLWDVYDDVWGLRPFWYDVDWVPSLGSGVTRPFPLINVYGNDEKVALTSELPGLNVNDLDIRVTGRTLTITGNRTIPELSEDECYACKERNEGEFTRSLSLPFEVDAAKVEARYEDGVLVLTLPRAESDKARKITVKAA